MANIDFAALSGNARVSAVLHRMIELKLADRAELYKAPQFLNFGSQHLFEACNGFYYKCLWHRAVS